MGLQQYKYILRKQRDKFILAGAQKCQLHLLAPVLHPFLPIGTYPKGNRQGCCSWKEAALHSSEIPIVDDQEKVMWGQTELFYPVISVMMLSCSTLAYCVLSGGGEAAATCIAACPSSIQPMMYLWSLPLELTDLGCGLCLTQKVHKEFWRDGVKDT